MRKIITFILILAVLCSVAYAQGMQGEGAGQAAAQPTLISEQGSDMMAEIQDAELQQTARQIQQKIEQKSTTQIREAVQERAQELQQEIEAMPKKEQEAYKNQNEVRLAVHSLLAIGEALNGNGIGAQVREIARNFNNSIQATIRAEQKIETKSGFARFFTGGDEEAAQELEQEAAQNQQRIQQLEQLKNECECGDDMKALIQEQVQQMQQEQERLQELAQKETKSKGIFGWIWK